MSESIAERYRAIRSAIADRARDHEVAILAVAKLQPIEKLREALLAGITRFAENYAQEGQRAMRELEMDKPRVEWHFIGHVQSKKVKYLVDYDCVQSLDRLEIAEDLNRRLFPISKKMRVLIEVNVGGEEQKSGIRPLELSAFLEKLGTLSYLRIAGLMAMPPALQPAESRRPFFKQMKELFERYKQDFEFDTLSMGTSEDYLIAVEEGATMVRLGNALMGERKTS